ncbi:MAG: hypothetical protein M1817_000755 [Caeruleum heppii]|nr:MAG: hypothetical protein M1817_000755 [Caeruleum heppii]
MKLSTSATLAVAATLLAGVDAHMHIAKPVPFKFENDGTKLSPLDPSGSDFPCKQPAASYQAQTTNTIPVGVEQPLTFTGSAVHGGGSCQISITKDLKPTKNSQWKVIHSIEGGCPVKAEGNLSPENPNNALDSGLKFTLPDGLADGAATLAWTWFNKIGNREMYMNCAPIEVTGGKGDDAFFDSLPNMYVANVGDALGTGQCKKTTEGNSLSFPNPGQSVSRSGESLTGECGPDGAQGGSGTSNGGASSGSGSSGSGAGSSGSGSSGSGASAASSSAAPVNTGGVFAAGAGSGSASSASSASSAPASSSIASSAPVAAPSAGTGPSSAAGASSNGSSSGAAGGSTGTCSTADAGKTLCNGDSMFGTCDQLGQVVWRPVAQGTVCKDGTIAAAAVKRHVRFSKHHIRRGHHFVV